MSKDEEELAIYHRRLNLLLQPHVFAHDKIAELFTFQGRQRLAVIAEAPDLHLHWDNRHAHPKLHSVLCLQATSNSSCMNEGLGRMHAWAA